MPVARDTNRINTFYPSRTRKTKPTEHQYPDTTQLYFIRSTHMLHNHNLRWLFTA